METKLIINDTLSLSEKKGVTSDSFYKGNDSRNRENTFILSDSQNVDVGDSRFFAILSTSGKEINNRVYSKDSWKETVTDKKWEANKYAKPLLRNHDLYHSDPKGRIKDSFFYDHYSGEIVNGSGKVLPKEVIDHYTSLDAFSEGSGSLIVEFTADNFTSQRMIKGLDSTVSQSSYMGKSECSICGKSYYDCSQHYAGRMYEVETAGVAKMVKCVLMASDFEPIELSIVNLPANDSSTIFVLNNIVETQSEDFKKEIVLKDSKIDEANKKVENDTVEGQTNAQTQLEVSQDMFKKIVKDAFIAKMEVKNLDMNEETKKAFDSLFETINDEQVSLFSDFLEKLTVKIEDEEQKEKGELEGTTVENGTVVGDSSAEVVVAVVADSGVAEEEEGLKTLTGTEGENETVVSTEDKKEVALLSLHNDNKKVKEFITDNKHLDAMLKVRF